MMSVLCDRAIVKKEGLWDVVGEDEWKINNLLDKKYEPRPAHEIIQEAESLLNQELPYCVFRSNCEHFVTDLRYGKPQSRQVRCAVNTLTKDLFSCSHDLYYACSSHTCVNFVICNDSSCCNVLTPSFCANVH